MIYKENKKSHIYVDPQKKNLQQFIKRRSINYAKNKLERNKGEQRSAEVSATDTVTEVTKETTHYTVSKLNQFIESRFSLRNPKAKNIKTNSINQEAIKKYVINKKTASLKASFFNGSKTMKDKAVKLVNIVKKSLPSSGLKLMAVTPILLTVVLFTSAFTTLQQDSLIIPSYVPLSEEVLAYEDTITKYCEEYGIKDFVPIIEAIMIQESRGKGTDPMQCSECPYNTKYPNTPNAIQDPEYSIKIGIKYFKECLDKAGVTGIDDIDRLSLAIQGYNYGNGYIEWALTNFGGYILANAKVFSNEMKDKLNTTVYGDPQYVPHVYQFIALGTGNIRGNPNFDNLQAWVSLNPYAQTGLYGQCTWFAWGRFYEIYGYSPGFTGWGSDCAQDLVNAHPDKFEISNTPAVDAVFSTLGHQHVGIVIGWDGKNITIQDGNLDGITNTFATAKNDWETITYEIHTFTNINGGAVYAVPKQET